MINVVRRLFSARTDSKSVADEKRPIKIVEEGKNTWRIVYAD